MSHKVKPKRDSTESYFRASLGYIILLSLALIHVSVGNDSPTFFTIFALSIFGSWTITMLGVRSHRKESDHHREYMNTH